ncbi:hypothetical protein [Neotamlana laminarinivorans]|uniref:Lipocalin-like domain-containing protein n=1 Tax=Neotamlana laminarinivorans TaxID=2883124 RepID=A0A9X1HZR0_9FLAO|nr:hypothetical protein [Tamlana laminarinivorans]MCB4798751.1 hypothetical protein [Tamlana laminarinivorans]
MKHFKKLTILLLIFSLHVSCSDDLDDNINEMLGVWEYTTEVDDVIYTSQLVLGTNNEAAKIQLIENSEGEVTSSFVGRTWRKENNSVVLVETNSEEIFNLINSQELVSAENADIVYVKVSSNYTDYLTE